MNWDYVAVLFDGKGAVCLGINRSRRARNGYLFCPLLSIAQRDIEFLKSVQRFIGSGCIIHEQGPRERDHALYFNGARSRLTVGEKFLPHLILKRRRM